MREARVLSVNVGAVREVEFHGELRRTGIWKQPVAGRVTATTTGLAGDQQADLVNHGGAEKALYAYGAEDAAWWAARLHVPVPPATFGENLTLTGIDLNAALIGESWRIGNAVVQVVQPRYPCWKLGLRMGDATFPAHFLAAARAGAYLRVLVEGDVGAGDAVDVLTRPEHGVTVGAVAQLNHADRPGALALLASVAAPATEPAV